ncbi:MAG: PilZ domain-containing protein [Spirochaetaceae bacterium]
MKSVMVIENPETKERISRHLAPLGFDFIHYSNPVKATDNIEEISPDLVLFSAEDFPRHWKPYLRLLRAVFSREETVFILLTGDSFPEEEASKATILGVNGIVGSSMEDDEDILKLEDIFSRYGFYNDERSDRRIPGKYAHQAEFLFTHPNTLSLITGTITDLSLGGLRLEPDYPHMTADIPEGITIDNASLSIEETLHTVSVKVIRNNRVLAFQYVHISADTKNDLIDYLNKTPERMLHQIS